MVTSVRDLDQRLELGPGMRVQRGLEAAFLLAAFFTMDVRFVYVTLASTVLQSLSPRLALAALVVAAFGPRREHHRLGDLYFDLGGSRGACAASALVQSCGVVAMHLGHPLAGLVILAVPTASFVLAPTVGFCCGCAFYVLGREVLARLGLVGPLAKGARDVDLEP